MGPKTARRSLHSLVRRGILLADTAPGEATVYRVNVIKKWNGNPSPQKTGVDTDHSPAETGDAGHPSPEREPTPTL